MARNEQGNKNAKHYDHPINQRLRELVNAQNIGELAQRLDVTQDAVNQWRAGYTRPDIDKLGKISTFFGVTTDYLLGISKDSIPDLEARAIVDKTGLSKQALDVLRELRENDGNGFKLWEVINLILTHSEFMGFLDDISCARTYSYLIAHKDMLASQATEQDIKEFEESFFDSRTDFLGVTYADFEEKVELEEFHATKRMNRIVSDLCADAHASNTVMQYIQGMTETGGDTNAET